MTPGIEANRRRARVWSTWVRTERAHADRAVVTITKKRRGRWAWWVSITVIDGTIITCGYNALIRRTHGTLR